MNHQGLLNIVQAYNQGGGINVGCTCIAEHHWLFMMIGVEAGFQLYTAWCIKCNRNAYISYLHAWISFSAAIY